MGSWVDLQAFRRDRPQLRRTDPARPGQGIGNGSPRAYAVPVVVGREAELQAVESFLDGPGSPPVLAIVGEPGIGKTTLWTHAVERAGARGAHVLAARPAESEARLSFAGLADLLATVPPALFTSLPTPQRAALDAALLRAPASHAPERRVTATGLLSLLRALAAEAETVVAIDDLQWLDPPSAAAVEFALRRVAADPIRAVVSVRTEEAGRLANLDVERVELRPLSVASLHRVLARELGRTFSRPALVRIATASGGSPLYALEIARREDTAVSDSLGSLVAARVRSLPPDARDALLCAAALARPTVALVDTNALAPAEEAELVRIRPDGRVEFVHPLFASAVYTSAATARRRRMHRALADVVDDPEERARHVALAASAPDEEAARELERAARGARLRGAPDAAAELTELALRLLPSDSPGRDELRFELAEHLYLASDFRGAAAVLEDLRATLRPGDLRARVLLLLADIVYWRDGESASLALSEEACRVARDPLVTARAHVEVAMAAATVDLPRARAAARAALELLEPRAEAEPALLAFALGAMVRADFFLGHGFDAGTAERALALEGTAPPAAVDTRVVFKLGQWLRYVDDFEGSRRRLAEAEQQAREEGDDSSLANILLNRVILETWAGELTLAAELAEGMVEAFAQHGVQAGGTRVWQAYVDAYAGRVDAVRSAAGGARRDEPVIAAIWDRTIGLAELAAGDAAAADSHLAAAVTAFDRVDFREPAVWRIDGDAIEAALGVGDVERGRRLAERFGERAARTGIPWSLSVSARCRALVRAADGDLDGAAEAVEQALVEHERCPMPFERARTLLVHGQVLRRLKRKRQAREALLEARGIFARIGAGPWAARAEAELRRVAVRRSPDVLSPTELQIARLAADGLTNRAIAEQAFVTVKTVEANLRRVYDKLGIRSRAQLARALDAIS
jgi:DNA-binding CsgD family transcriptional regulator